VARREDLHLQSKLRSCKVSEGEKDIRTPTVMRTMKGQRLLKIVRPVRKKNLLVEKRSNLEKKNKREFKKGVQKRAKPYIFEIAPRKYEKKNTNEKSVGRKRGTKSRTTNKKHKQRNIWKRFETFKKEILPLTFFRPKRVRQMAGKSKTVQIGADIRYNTHRKTRKKICTKEKSTQPDEIKTSHSLRRL